MALEDRLDYLTVPLLSMMSAAGADTLATYLNIAHHSVAIEANPLIRSLSSDLHVSSALIIPKAVAGGVALLVSFQMERDERYQTKGKYLLNLAAIYWSYGFLANLSLLVVDYLPK